MSKDATSKDTMSKDTILPKVRGLLWYLWMWYLWTLLSSWEPRPSNNCSNNHPHKQQRAFMRDETSLSAQYSNFDNEQELFIHFLAFKAASEDLKRGHFNLICEHTTQRSQVGVQARPFGTCGSQDCRFAQNLLHVYTKRLSGKCPGNLTRPPSDYCPYKTFLTGDLAAVVNSLLSFPESHASPANCITPVTSKKTMQSKTPPPVFKNMQNNKANHTY
jgi:hypothetical protein